MENSKYVFDNKIPKKIYKKALKSKKKYLKKFGDDSKNNYMIGLSENNILGQFLGVKNIIIEENGTPLDMKKGLVIGNIRMGFGHYRISMAIASAAHFMGYTPYWFDLNSYKQTTASKIISHLNNLYSMGSRWSQKYPIFNKFYWEPLNYNGFKKLSYNAVDQKITELMTPIFRNIPKDMPFIATHVWPAQAAIHAGVTNVVNVIPDNWPMALHLAEGSKHMVQTPSSFWGYKTLKGMDKTKILNPIPSDKIFNVGHYIDHELVTNIDYDCNKRLYRINNFKAKRILLTIGGAGAQKKIFSGIISKILPMIKEGKVILYLNIGDYKNVWDELCNEIPDLSPNSTTYFDNWDLTSNFTQKAIEEEILGIHVFYHKDIFAAVYSTNLLMRSSDLMITKPSELSFYPVPKLLIKRVGGHEAWGAVRSSEIGDGTIECETIEQSLQMLELLLDNNENLLKNMCNSIIEANKIEIYSGAYKVVSHAINNTI